MPKKRMTSAGTYLSEPCQRCGSKKRVAKTWDESVPTLTGTTIIQYSQIVCTNDVCQIEFDKQLLDEKEKRQEIRVKKEADQAIRKANSSSFKGRKAK